MGQCLSEELHSPRYSSPNMFKNDALGNLIDFIDYDVENLSTGEEVAWNTLVTLNQFIEKGINTT